MFIQLIVHYYNSIFSIIGDSRNSEQCAHPHFLSEYLLSTEPHSALPSTLTLGIGLTHMHQQ